MLEQQAVAGSFSNKKNFFFRDKAHFTLDGYINKQNCRILGSANPQIIEERTLHSESHCLVPSLVRRCDCDSSKTVIELLSSLIRIIMVI